MKKILLPLFALACFQASGQINLFTDNFNTPDTANFDSAPLTGRLSGLAAGDTSLQSFGTEESISGNMLALVGAPGGVRWGGGTSRYDWSGATTGSSILAAGGFNVSFVWTTTDNTDSEWIAFKVGTPNNDSHISDGNIDNGILFRKTGGTVNFNYGSGTTGGNFATVPGGSTFLVSLTYTFSSFADGSTANVLATVDGTTVVTSSFALDDVSKGGFFMDLENDSTGNKIDNLSVTTIAPVPEPTTACLGLVGLAAIAWRRRK
jgi:hypothetical protein